MQQTWRWFGPDNDPVRVEHMLQAGVEAVVTALYDVPTGDVWTRSAISDRQQDLRTRRDGGAGGLRWSVVENLPVSDAIKRKGPQFTAHVANYRTSLENLAACGINTVCCNLMPVLDWTRTKLRQRLPHGGTAMVFDLIDFTVFEVHLLAREGATEDYGAAVVAQAEIRHRALSDADKAALTSNVVAGLPGAKDALSLERLRELLALW